MSEEQVELNPSIDASLPVAMPADRHWQQTTGRFLRLKEVQKRVPFSRSTIYRMVQRGQFPKPFNIGVRAVAWLESDIQKWMEQQVQRPQ